MRLSCLISCNLDLLDSLAGAAGWQNWFSELSWKPMHKPPLGSGRPSFHGSFQHVHEDSTTDDRQQIAIEHLTAQIRDTADKLVRDGPTPAAVKLLRTTLKQPRYA